MQCPNCEANLHPGGKFCAYCATPLPEHEEHSGNTTILAPRRIHLFRSMHTSEHTAETDKEHEKTHVETPEEAHAALHKAERLAEREREKTESANERLMIFSDGVIAFALTIAAVSIKIPKDLEELNAVVFTIRLFTYVMSFIFVYNLWKEHHSIFHHIKRNDGWLIALNSFYLALVVLIPISLNIMDIGLINIATHPDAGIMNPDTYSFLLFLGSLLGASIMLNLIWRHALNKRPKDLFADAKPEKAFIVYTNWRLSVIPFSLLFYIPAYVMIASNRWDLGIGIVVGYTLVRWLFFLLYRRRLQNTLDLSTGNEDIMRIQLFSDAIIGIAITIAAAQIDPSFNINDSSAVDTVMRESWSLLGTYIFSFIFMGIYWLLHYNLFRFIKRYDSTLVMLNFVFLILIILMFIPARMYTSHMASQKYAIVFSFWQFMIAGVLWAMWQYAVSKSRTAHGHRLLKRSITAKRRKRFARIIQANPIIFFLLAVAGGFTPILTTIYIAAYLALLGGVWLVSHWATRRLPEDIEEEKAEAVPELVTA